MVSLSAEERILSYIRSKVSLKHLIRQNIVVKDGDILGFHCHVVLESGEILASGTHSDWKIARQIAVAETLERIVAMSLRSEKELELFKIRKVPSTSGFAAGFDSTRTRFRSVCEGLERWAWSQWIDHQFKIEEVHPEKLTSLALHLKEGFEKVIFFKKIIKAPFLQANHESLNFGVVLGLTRSGVFPGSRVTAAGDDLWTHGLIEAARNLNNFNIWQAQGMKIDSDWFSDRVRFFGANKDVALEAIGFSQNPEWPAPEIDICLPVDTRSEDFHVWRCLFKDFVPWNEGTERRFVY